MANFLLAKEATFRIVLPFDCRRTEDPRPIFAARINDLPLALQAVPEESIEYHSCTFRRPGWGLECFTRELAYTGDQPANRAITPERLGEVRLRYLLTASSLLPEITLVSQGGYQILSDITEGVVKQIDPAILRVFLVIASHIWDGGDNPSNLLREEDYKSLRNDPNGLQLLSEKKGLVPPKRIVKEDEADKKKLETEPEPLSGPASSPVTIPT